MGDTLEVRAHQEDRDEPRDETVAPGDGSEAEHAVEQEQRAGARARSTSRASSRLWAKSRDFIGFALRFVLDVKPGCFERMRLTGPEVEPVGPAHHPALRLGRQEVLHVRDAGPVDLGPVVMLLMVTVVEPEQVVEQAVAAHRVGLAVARLRAVVLEVILPPARPRCRGTTPAGRSRPGPAD